MAADIINQMLVETVIPVEQKFSTIVSSYKGKGAKDSSYEFLAIVKSYLEVD